MKSWLPRYYVVDFLELPHSGIDKYVCVPESWLTWRDKWDLKVKVAYPKDRSLNVDDLATKDKNPPESWKSYMAFVKYATSFFEDGTNYIEKQEKPIFRRSVLSGSTNRRRSRRNDPSNPELDWPQLVVTPVDGGYLINNKVYKRSSPADFDKNALIKWMRVEDMIESAREVAKQSDALVDKRLCVHDQLLNECLRAPATVEDLFIDARAEKADPNTSTQLTSSDLSEKMRDDVIYIDDDDSNANEGPKKKRVKKFTLPPEYDPNDSRWTLRYREPAPELVELLPSSGLYVNAIRLTNCHRLARDCRSLARKLMMEVFSDSALKVCSLTGAKAAFFDYNQADVRPGLDQVAREIMMRYVESYGRQRGWCTRERQGIINSLRNKLQDCRTRRRGRL